MKIYVGIVLLVSFLLSGCQPKETVTLTEQKYSSIKGVKFKGPGAYCGDIDDLLSSPPDDMSAKQKKVTELSRDACSLPSDDITIDDAQSALNGKKVAYKIEGNILTLFARHAKEEAIICCSIQSSLLQIGQVDGHYLFAKRFRLKDLDAARLEFFAPDYFESQDRQKEFYKGTNAFADLDMLEFKVDKLGGKMIIENVIKSEALGEDRIYDLYLPKGFKAGDKVGLIVLGDGGSLGFFVRQWEPLINKGTLGKFVAIGVRSGQRGIANPGKEYDFDVRNADYIKGIKHGPQRFDDHLKFVADELIPAVTAELNLNVSPENTVLMGGSSAGSFALWGVMTRPDIFGVSIGTSPSGPVPESISVEASRRKYYISAGLYEPGFHYNAIGYYDILSAAGAEADLITYSDGHSSDHRQRRMADLLPHIFPGPDPK